MKIKTVDLIGKALDWAVALAEDPSEEASIRDYPDGALELDDDSMWQPSELWEHGGPIIQRERIKLDYRHRDFVPDLPDESCAQVATFHWVPFYYGPTPLVAAMRAYVGKKLGEEVDIPDEIA